jgi:hypothetical protein
MHNARPKRKYTAEEKQHILANLDIEGRIHSELFVVC